jgi:AcrR family transcriptional regulator
MTATIITRALRADVPEGADHILDAALALAAASGLRNLTMDDVARKAGVGRMTVYRRFGTREALIDALSAREVRRCLDELEDASPLDAPIEDQIAAGFAVALRLSREHPMLARLARIEPDTVLQAFTADGGALMDLCRAVIVDRLQRAGAQLAVPLEEAAELVARVMVSFVLLPDSALDLDDPDLGRRLLAPLLVGS